MQNIKDINGAKFYIRPDSWDENVVESVASGKEYEHFSGGNVIDIGGHIGSYSIMCALNGANVIVFEPTKENYEMLVKNIKLNGLEDKITAINKAVVGKERPFKISFSQDNTGSSSEDNKGYEVETISFDNVMDMFLNIDMLKLDCEGTEHEFNIEDHLDKVKEIVAEIHYKKTFVDKLQGFEIKMRPSNASKCWMLYARNNR